MPTQTSTTKNDALFKQTFYSGDAPFTSGSDGRRTVKVSFHREHDSGDVIETCVSSDKNHVTARSVNSPHDITLLFNQDLNQPHTPTIGQTLQGVHRTEQFAYAQKTFSNTQDRFISGPGHHYPIGIKLPSYNEVSRSDAIRSNLGPFEVSQKHTDDRKFGVGIPRIQRTGNNHESSMNLRNAASANSNFKYSNGDLSSHDITLLQNGITRQARDPMEMPLSGRIDRQHVVYPNEEFNFNEYFPVDEASGYNDTSPTFIAVPVNSNIYNDIEHGNRIRARSTEAPYLKRRSRSLNYHRERQPTRGYLIRNQDRKYRTDQVQQSGKAIFLDGHLYAKKNTRNYDSDDNYEHYTPLDSRKDMSDSFDNLQLGSDLEDVDLNFERFNTENIRRVSIREKRRGRSSRHSESDFNESIPVYTSRRHGSDLLLPRREKYNSMRRNKHDFRRVSLLSCSDDDVDVFDDGKRNDSANKSSRYTQRRQVRQQIPNIFSENKEHVSSINVTSDNDKVLMTPTFGMLSPNTFTPNFPLYPNVGLGPSAGLPYTVGLPSNVGSPLSVGLPFNIGSPFSVGLPAGLTSPYSTIPFPVTYGPMSPLVGNGSITYPNMKNSFNAMGASLASIPAPTISASPYIYQQLLPQDSSNPFDVAPQKYSHSSDTQNTISTPLGATVATQENLQPNQQTTKKTSGIGDGQSWRCRGQTQSINEINGTASDDISTSHFKNDPDNLKSTSNFKDILNRILDNKNKPTGQRNDNNENVPENNLMRKSKQIIISDQSNSAKKASDSNNSADTHNFDPQLSHTGKPTPPQSPTDRSENAQQLSKETFSPTQLSATNIHHTKARQQQPITATFKEERSPETLLSLPLANTHKHNQSYNTSLNHPKFDNLINYDQLLNENMFEISNVTVIEDLGKYGENRHILNGNFVKKRIELFSALSDDSDYKHSVTQITSPTSSHPPVFGHPDPDYDVYPRKPNPINTLNKQSKTVKDARARIMSSKSYSYQSSVPSNIHRQISQSNNFLHRSDLTQDSTNSVFHEEKSLPLDFMSHIGSTGQQDMHGPINAVQSQKHKSNGVFSAPKPLQTKQTFFSKHSHSSKNAKQSKISQFEFSNMADESHSYAAMPSSKQLRQRQFPQKLDGSDTDSSSIPFQIYTGDPFLLAQSNTRNQEQLTNRKRTPSPKENMSPFINSNLEHDNQTSGLSDSGYIFYKGPSLVSIIPGEVFIPVFDHTENTTFDPTANRRAENLTEMVENNDMNKKSTKDKTRTARSKSKNLDQRDQEMDLSNNGHSSHNIQHNNFRMENDLEIGHNIHGIPKHEIPIPPRDFDSDADSSEFIYTSKGWSPLTTTPNTVTAMYCTGVEDNSANYFEHLYETTKNPMEAIMQRFLRDVDLNDISGRSLTNTDILRSEPNFKRLIWNEWTTNHTQMKLDKDVKAHINDNARKTCLFDGFDKCLERHIESHDLDSGVSLASDISADFRDLDSYVSDDVALPGEDYSSVRSSTIDSMQLGWDYLSCNESVRDKERKVVQ